MNNLFKSIIVILLYILFIILNIYYSLFNYIFVIIVSILLVVLFLFYLKTNKNILFYILVIILSLFIIHYLYNKELFKEISFSNNDYYVIEGNGSNNKLGIFEYDKFNDNNLLKEYSVSKYNDMMSLFNDIENGNISSALINSKYYDCYNNKEIINKDNYKITNTVKYIDNYVSMNNDIKKSYTIFVEGINSKYEIMYARVISINLETNKLAVIQIPSDYYIELYSILKREKLEYLNYYNRDIIESNLTSLFNVDIDYIVEFNVDELLSYFSSNIKYCFKDNYNSSKVSYSKGCHNFKASSFSDIISYEYSLESDIWNYFISNYNLSKRNLLKLPIKTDISKDVFIDFVRSDFKYKKKNISFYKLEGLAGHDRVLSSNKYEWIEYPNYDSVSTATSKMMNILEIDN